ncbi:MAG: bifunctional heptose 7-phosphate kinase/heptose 1-phosphate adenyltransferase [Spirochaetales bacterium]|nr:bifunctional heptose 7-phosphate kinase/heptose 1-phosphate adenyltransferase [Spirochaetales bacterium]
MVESPVESLRTARNFLVVGDLMVDCYVRGEIKRISPEAPVPVLTVTEKENKPGGAGNVALNLAGLNSAVTLFGFVGDDESGRILTDLLGRADVDCRGILWDRNTISKTRITSARQQIVRVDEERDQPPSREERERLMKSLAQVDFSRFDGVLLSDYNKGVCFPELCQFLIKESRRAGLPLVVDPKGRDWEKYRGAPLITPNVKELGDAWGGEVPNGDDSVAQAALALRERFSFDRMAVTRSDKGMTLAWEEGIGHFPTQAREVYDVSGAGDTVAAGLLRFLSDSFSPPEAVRWANRAAGIVVGFLGTHPITKALLLEERRGESCLSWEAAREKGGAIVFTNGCFDLLHPGHMDYLRRARQLGDFLVVGLNSDDSVRRLKGKSRPVNGEKHRKIMLESLAFVDQVLLFEEDTPARLIQEIGPDFLVKGGDYRPEDIVGREWAGETLSLPFLPGFSSTTLMERIKELDG